MEQKINLQEFISSASPIVLIALVIFAIIIGFKISQLSGSLSYYKDKTEMLEAAFQKQSEMLHKLLKHFKH